MARHTATDRSWSSLGRRTADARLDGGRSVVAERPQSLSLLDELGLASDGGSVDAAKELAHEYRGAGEGFKLDQRNVESAVWQAANGDEETPTDFSQPNLRSRLKHRWRAEQGDPLLTDESAQAADVPGLRLVGPPRAVPGNSGGKLVDLEGYRGLAAVGIVIFHSYQFARGTSGTYAYQNTVAYHILLNLDALVSLFLVLSAFLLYAPLVRNILDGTSAPPAKIFLFRRAVRILPLYWSAILIVWTYRNPTLPGDWRDLVEHLTFTQVFDKRRIFYTIGPAWSLSVEVMFYLLLAALYFAVNLFGVHKRSYRVRLAAVWLPVIALTLVSVGYLGWALGPGRIPDDRWDVWFSPLSKAFMFAGGMGLAVIYTRRDSRPIRRGAIVVLRVAALILLAVGCAIRTESAPTTTAFNVLSASAFVLLLASSVFARAGSWWRQVLSSPILTWSGLISYSIYLWHEPVLLYLDQHHKISHDQAAFIFDAILLLVLTIPIAALSYWVLEYPIGKLRMLYNSRGVRHDYYPHIHHFEYEEAS